MSVAFVIQHAKCARLFYCHVTYPALQHFSTLSHKWHDFREKFLNVKRVSLFFSINLSETFLILRIAERDMIMNV
jgi:hypothetical protein